MRALRLSLVGTVILAFAGGVGSGKSVETVSAFPDHSSSAVTTTCRRRLEWVEDHSWERVAEAIGVSAGEG